MSIRRGRTMPLPAWRASSVRTTRSLPWGRGSADLALLAELTLDGRSDEAPYSAFENDAFIGFRWTLNDVQGTSGLGSPVVDLNHGETIGFLRSGPPARHPTRRLRDLQTEPVLVGRVEGADSSQRAQDDGSCVWSSRWARRLYCCRRRFPRSGVRARQSLSREDPEWPERKSRDSLASGAC